MTHGQMVNVTCCPLHLTYIHTKVEWTSYTKTHVKAGSSVSLCGRVRGSLPDVRLIPGNPPARPRSGALVLTHRPRRLFRLLFTPRVCKASKRGGPGRSANLIPAGKREGRSAAPLCRGAQRESTARSPPLPQRPGPPSLSSFSTLRRAGRLFQRHSGADCPWRAPPSRVSRREPQLSGCCGTGGTEAPQPQCPSGVAPLPRRGSCCGFNGLGTLLEDPLALAPRPPGRAPARDSGGLPRWVFG